MARLESCNPAADSDRPSRISLNAMRSRRYWAHATVALYPYDDNLINRSKQSVKLLELMASGCAIVASDVGDIRRIGGKGLSVVQPGDATAFSAKILRLIDDPLLSRSVWDEWRSERSSIFAIDRLADRLSQSLRAKRCKLRW